MEEIRLLNDALGYVSSLSLRTMAHDQYSIVKVQSVQMKRALVRPPSFFLLLADPVLCE
jgi:hypothetical protein